MVAIAISLLFGGLAALAAWTIASSLKRGMVIGREIVAELAALDKAQVSSSPTFRPLRGRPAVSQQAYTRQAVRLRPLRRPCAAA